MPIIGNPVKGRPLAQIVRAQGDPAALSASIDFILEKIQARISLHCQRHCF
ncbi:hypothetical protein [Polynucleobacter necessarius]|uniref:hypothetical protein n=1 Tax=Polynucleobacter necessarius TaxID=576610 RepID=UPI0018D506E5|nr:hypothetical protein [Polynucleobacter necessarius]